ncbi:MAG: TetR/AcrR family transcriptional regulator [Myxococcota bacterium]
MSKKPQQILQGAKSAFLELGFERASVDEIARRAGVSKATVYAHFEDKETLFGAAIEDEANAAKGWLSDFPALEAAMRAALGRENISPSPETAEAAVRYVTDHFLRFLLSPMPRANYRIVVAESLRFPRLGHLLWKHGPEAGMVRIAHFFREATARGYLRIDDPEEAARALCDFVDGRLSRKVRMGAAPTVTEDEIVAEVDAIVKLFLRLYPPRSECRQP